MSASVTVERHILREHNAMLGFGDFGELFEAYHTHARKWNLPLDGLGTVLMHQALAGAALQLAFRVVDETSAWTLNIDQPAANVFVAGGGADNQVTGRYFVDDVEQRGESRLFVQRAHPQRETTRSVLSVTGIDLFEIFEQYFSSSEQLPARFVELSSTEMAMVLALPNADADWLEGLDPTAVKALQETTTEVIDGRRFKFSCGCDGDRIARTLVGMFGDEPDDLFAGDDGVEANCPRCGALWWIDRDFFEAARDPG